MRKKLAIKGHPTRGKEVIELLEMMGGINDEGHIGTNSWKDEYYFLDNGYIRAYDWCDGIKFTLEGFLYKYPFKVGDKVVYEDDNDILVISEMKWDDTVGDIFYKVKRIDGDDCFLCPPELLKLYKETNMSKRLAIRGHATRGKEVIELLEMLGGKNNCDSLADNLGLCYLIDDEFDICAHYFGFDDYEDGELSIFTLEEFLEKYPFKVGDKVFLYDNITEGCVTGMEWDEDIGTVKYCVYTSAEYWCDVEKLLKWNKVDSVEKHYRDNMEEKDKAKAPDIKGEDYSDKRFGYKIPDGYEFDVVVDGKIILKPIKPKYPKTYKDCCEVLVGRKPKPNEISFDKMELCLVDLDNTQSIDFQAPHLFQLNSLFRLLMCLDAYRKIAGEEMGLGKPWEPYDSKYRYIIRRVGDAIVKGSNVSSVLEFPTVEMRDAFYENFKDLIEECKELL